MSYCIWLQEEQPDPAKYGIKTSGPFQIKQMDQI